jgi:hypothetical protein
MDLLDERGCPSNNPPYGWQSLMVCAASYTPGADFGGAYQRYGTTCYVGNPSAGGQCACPTGTQAIELVVDGQCYHDVNIGLCWDPTATRTAFGGAYQTSTGGFLNNTTCVVKNPATNDCTCPAGTTAASISDVYGQGPPDSQCTKSGATSGNLYFCH